VYNAIPAGTANYALYLQRTDGQPPVLLGEGQPLTIAPDGKTVAATLPMDDSTLLLIPAGAGETRRLRSARLHYRDALWLPGDRLLVSAFETGRRPRTYVLDLSGGDPKPLTPEGVQAVAASPDGTTFLGRDEKGTLLAYATATGEPRPLAGIDPGEQVVQWIGGQVLVSSPGPPLTVHAVDPVSGRRSEWRRFTDVDPAGLVGVPRVHVTPDGARYLLVSDRMFASMFLVRRAR
jgi:hypothetical protein